MLHVIQRIAARVNRPIDEATPMLDARLADGSRWTQMDGKVLALSPRNGEKVVVKKGALGAYFLSVERQPGVKVKRIN